MTSVTAQPIRRVEECMGTVFSFDVRSPGVALAAVEEAVDWLHHVDRTFSTYRSDSIVSALCRNEITVAECPAEVREVLDRCEQLRAETDGFFDAWAGGRLDPSGYVKGWAIEIASDILADAGSVNHCVNGGGDVQCVGTAGPGRPWIVGIAHPHRLGQFAARVQGQGRLAVATSGSAERGAHIVDPHGTDRPAGLAAVSVIGTDLSVVDAYATAAYAMGADAAAWLGRRPGISWLVIDVHGREFRSGVA